MKRLWHRFLNLFIETCTNCEGAHFCAHHSGLMLMSEDPDRYCICCGARGEDGWVFKFSHYRPFIWYVRWMVGRRLKQWKKEENKKSTNCDRIDIFEGYGEYDSRFADPNYGDNPNYNENLLK